MPTFALIVPDKATVYVDVEKPKVVGPHFEWGQVARREAVRLGLLTEAEAKVAQWMAAVRPPEPHPYWR